MSRPETILDAAETVATILHEFEIDAVVIGALALAAHHYVRFTEDIDLAVNADLETLRQLAKALREREFQVDLREPDPGDPLSGVIDVRGPFGMVQIVNFGQTFPAVISDAIRDATLAVRPGSKLRLAPIPHLVALKLYAGGFKSKGDIAELLARNPDADLNEIRDLCVGYALKGLEEIIDEIPGA